MSNGLRKLKKNVKQFNSLLENVKSYIKNIDPNLNIEDIKNNIQSDIKINRKANKNKKKAERRARRA
jgi:hypothetical protein